MGSLSLFGCVCVICGCGLFGWVRWLRVYPTKPELAALAKHVDELEKKVNGIAFRKLSGP